MSLLHTLQINRYKYSRFLFSSLKLNAAVVVSHSGNSTCGCPPVKSSCGSGGGGGPSGINVLYKEACPRRLEDHDYKNMRMNRPMSPHLTIYEPTLPAMTSIMQRITGVILTSYVVLIAGGTLFLSNGVDTYVYMIQNLDLSRMSTMLVKLIVGFPFAYHYWNGIRFCAWNAGKWLDMKMVYTSAYRAILLSLIIDFLFAML